MGRISIYLYSYSRCSRRTMVGRRRGRMNTGGGCTLPSRASVLLQQRILSSGHDSQHPATRPIISGGLIPHELPVLSVSLWRRGFRLTSLQVSSSSRIFMFLVPNPSAKESSHRLPSRAIPARGTSIAFDPAIHLFDVILPRRIFAMVHASCSLIEGELSNRAYVPIGLVSA